jgi:elongation factor Ts
MGTTTVNISANQVKELREKTGAPMMDCKQALTEAKGDMEQAVVLLRKKGVSVAAKKATRITSEGSVASYIHAGGKIGVLVEVNCESDFVARTEDFKELIHDIAMHIAASDPKFIRKEDVTPEAYEREKDIYRAQAAQTGKPPQVVEKIVEGKMRSASTSSPSSRTRQSPSRNSSRPRSASWRRTSACVVLPASRSATLARPSPSVSLNKRRSKSGAASAALF